MNTNSRNLTLLTDLYELTMMQGYFKTHSKEHVVFDVFYRQNPCGGAYAIACGLDQAIDYIKDLNFEQVQFEIHFAEKKEYSKDGIDDAEFRISLNQGQQVKPLTEVASGGELSRIMLAIKAVMADKDEIETLIFDEIDVGISGRTAQKVSEKMALIGKEHQVICITHLAQIAAMADQHFLIEKKTEDAVTRTHIYPLTEEKSVEELARILGGAKITDTVIQSAKEMKNLAGQIK